MPRRRLLALGATLAGAITLRRPRRAIAAWGDQFSNVEWVEPDEALAFLAGRHRAYPHADLDSIQGFSPANIVETMDTELLDEIAARAGPAVMDRLYRLIATNLLDALRWVYVPLPVVLALDAGHGGRPDVYYDPGANGTEAMHARRVVEALEALAETKTYAGITVRRIFNDTIGDDFHMPSWYDCDGATSRILRNVRAAMLTRQATWWNREHPRNPIVVHMLSVHFNAGSGSMLVLHQGESVPDHLREPSIAYAKAYLERTRPALYDSGMLPYPLPLMFGTGMSDDRLLYDSPPCFTFNPYTGADLRQMPSRYSMLQASPEQRDFVAGVLRYHGLD